MSRIPSSASYVRGSRDQDKGRGLKYRKGKYSKKKPSLRPRTASSSTFQTLFRSYSLRMIDVFWPVGTKYFTLLYRGILMEFLILLLRPTVCLKMRAIGLLHCLTLFHQAPNTMEDDKAAGSTPRNQYRRGHRATALFQKSSWSCYSRSFGIASLGLRRDTRAVHRAKTSHLKPYKQPPRRMANDRKNNKQRH